jgi:hypothetical protein
LGLAAYGSSDESGSEQGDKSAAEPQEAVQPAAALESSSSAATGLGGFNAFGSRRKLARARKGGLPLFNKPVHQQDSSDSDDGVCTVTHTV